MQKTLSVVSIALEWIGQFAINGLPEHYYYYCYPHWSSLVLQNRNGTAGFIHIREGLMQRYPLAMATYVIGIIPLIKQLKAEFPDIPYTWYAYNICALGMFAKIDLYFNPQKNT